MKTIALTIVLIASAAGLAACGPSSETKSTDGKTTSKMDMKSKDAEPAATQDAKQMDQMSKGDMKGMDHSAMKVDGKAASHKASASVKSLDANAQIVTLDHGPVASMNWPAMTMSFKVKDKSMFDKLEVDKKVEVEFVQQGGDYIITDVK
jgi:Cu/Ag efflux protein CusF